MGYWGVFKQEHGITKIVYTSWTIVAASGLTSKYILNDSGILKTIDFNYAATANTGLATTAIYIDGVQFLPACDPSFWNTEFDSATRAPWITEYALNGPIYCGYNFVDGIRFDSKLEIKTIGAGLGVNATAGCYIWYEQREI